jgi:hypothetical protein
MDILLKPSNLLTLLTSVTSTRNRSARGRRCSYCGRHQTAPFKTISGFHPPSLPLPRCSESPVQRCCLCDGASSELSSLAWALPFSLQRCAVLLSSEFADGCESGQSCGYAPTSEFGTAVTTSLIPSLIAPSRWPLESATSWLFIVACT